MREVVVTVAPERRVRRHGNDFAQLRSVAQHRIERRERRLHEVGLLCLRAGPIRARADPPVDGINKRAVKKRRVDQRPDDIAHVVVAHDGITQIILSPFSALPIASIAVAVDEPLGRHREHQGAQRCVEPQRSLRLVVLLRRQVLDVAQGRVRWAACLEAPALLLEARLHRERPHLRLGVRLVAPAVRRRSGARCGRRGAVRRQARRIEAPDENVVESRDVECLFRGRHETWRRTWERKHGQLRKGERPRSERITASIRSNLRNGEWVRCDNNNLGEGNEWKTAHCDKDMFN